MADSIHNEVYRELINALVSARKDAGLTQQTVADRLGKPQSYIAKIEGLERRLDIIEFLLITNEISLNPIQLIDQAKRDLLR